MKLMNSRGRVFTIFSLDCRLGLPPGKPFFLHTAGLEAAVVMLREFEPLEFVDPSNSVTPALKSEDPVPFRTAKQVALPETDKVTVYLIKMVPTDIKLESPEVVCAAIADASILVVFEPLGTAASLRSRLSTEIAIVVECTRAEWEALPPGQFDERHSEVWDEFIRTYHMVTADVRPPFWNDTHQLMVIKQGWAAYEQAAEQLEWTERLTLPCAALPIDRHRVSFSHAQEGTFQFHPSVANDAMRQWLAEGEPVPLSRETLSGAQRAVDLHRTGKTAVIECTIAMEVAVEQVVTSAKLKGGVSKKKLYEYKKEIGLGYQLNVDLPMILAPLTDAERSIIGNADAVRKRRDQIVHEGAQPTREQGQQAVSAVRALLDFLYSRGYRV